MKRADMDLICLDFAELHRQAPEQAVAAALALLLDESICRRTAAFLDALAERPRTAHDFSFELNTLTEPGLAQAMREGSLAVERFDALFRDPVDFSRHIPYWLRRRARRRVRSRWFPLADSRNSWSAGAVPTWRSGCVLTYPPFFASSVCG